MTETTKSFTPEAKQLLERESKRLAQELEEAAIREAFLGRGDPVEVTVRDVMKATVQLESRQFAKRERSVPSVTNFMPSFYLVIGVMMAVGGVSYPIIKPLLDQANEETRTSLFIAATGIILILFSISFRFIIALRREIIASRNYVMTQRKIAFMKEMALLRRPREVAERAIGAGSEQASARTESGAR